ncbi:MAG: hypothetical protein K2K31_00590, partial [Clostridia bacterium]|nr:hypothetical protein [Clostridia bacterium]
MEVRLLGSQSPYCKINKACPSYLVTDGETKILLDCGSGSHRFFDMLNDLDNLNIFVSHLHRDHYNDIFIYQYSSQVLKNLGFVKNGIHIYLPKNPVTISDDIKSEKACVATFDDIEEDKVFQIDDLKVEFSRNIHSKKCDVFAIKVSKKDKCIVYSSDTSYASKDRLVEFAKGADLFICESSYIDAYGYPEICNHLRASQAATIAKEAGVKRMVLTHFWPEEDLRNYMNDAKKIFKNVDVAQEN